MRRSDATNAGQDIDEVDWLGITPPSSTQAPHRHAIGRQERKPKGLKTEWPRDVRRPNFAFCKSNVNGDDDCSRILDGSLVVELT